MYVLGCGSREWTDAVSIREALVWLPEEATIIHGDAWGADLCFDFEAQQLGFQVEAYPADWTGFGSAAGPIRNQRMLKVLTKARKDGHEVMVLAFHEDPQLGIGTRDMVKRSIKAKIPVLIFIREYGAPCVP